jgi:long-chain acyl-CoA synthetase
MSTQSKNREEWVIADLACVHAAITSVPLYDTLGKEAVEYILDQAYIKTVFCEPEKVKNLVALKKAGNIQTVTHIIYFEDTKPVI